jgi:hypothetical protein
VGLLGVMLIGLKDPTRRGVGLILKALLAAALILMTRLPEEPSSQHAVRIRPAPRHLHHHLNRW